MDIQLKWNDVPQQVEKWQRAIRLIAAITADLNARGYTPLQLGLTDTDNEFDLAVMVNRNGENVWLVYDIHGRQTTIEPVKE